MTDQPPAPSVNDEVSDEAFESLRQQVERLAAEIARRDAVGQAQAEAEVSHAIATLINPILAEHAMRERAEGDFSLH
ncbi:hypothetical protein [Brevundimonas sp.]|uniref:hypothetical protein n=1 Tax=Brevundimonas sp. TaxID=1871086 RepID=UPI0018399767|nr:hypothetical protein [Brevundimonas sp.]MBA4807061.1 hypothetical protein [Brevundimonas sp.]